jgi:2-dehydropantoate 2-reductase
VLDTLSFKADVPVEASTEIEAAQDADVVLFCVKTTDNRATARALAPLLKPGCIVLSLQNGVDNVEQLRHAAGIVAFQAVVYVAASVPEPGRIKHVGRGDLVLGPETSATQALSALFIRAGIDCRISDNIEGELWTKLIVNCALNAVSALGRADYGRIAGHAAARELVATIIAETLAVARAARVVLPRMDTVDTAMSGAMMIAAQMTQAMSSTAQDLARGKCTEIDALNGYIARRGAELGVPTPVNQALFALVKLVELGLR